MKTKRAASGAVANHLLAALPTADYNRIAATLRTIPLPLKQILQNPGEEIDRIYFPGGGFCSILAVLRDGSMVEVATVGKEGMLGVHAIADHVPTTSMIMVQGEIETCYTMPVSAFRAEMDRHGAFYNIVGRFAQALTGFIMQSTACNAAHTIEQRLARWLLHAGDRMESDAFPLTQEFVAMMLGASRPMVTVAAGTLQKAGLITYRHGRVTIVDRHKLEDASCECYQAATAMIAQVVNPAVGESAKRA